MNTATLKARIERLEKTAPASGFTSILCKIVDPERPDAEGIRCTDGEREWFRANDESEQQFEERVSSQIKVTASECIPAVVMFSDRGGHERCCA